MYYTHNYRCNKKEVNKMEKVKMNNLAIGGHEYTIEKMTPKGTRELYHFNDRN